MSEQERRSQDSTEKLRVSPNLTNIEGRTKILLTVKAAFRLYKQYASERQKQTILRSLRNQSLISCFKEDLDADDVCEECSDEVYIRQKIIMNIIKYTNVIQRDTFVTRIHLRNILETIKKNKEASESKASFQIAPPRIIFEDYLIWNNECIPCSQFLRTTEADIETHEPIIADVLIFIIANLRQIVSCNKDVCKQLNSLLHIYRSFMTTMGGNITVCHKIVEIYRQRQSLDYSDCPIFQYSILLKHMMKAWTSVNAYVEMVICLLTSANWDAKRDISYFDDNGTEKVEVEVEDEAADQPGTSSVKYVVKKSSTSEVKKDDTSPKLPSKPTCKHVFRRVKLRADGQSASECTGPPLPTQKSHGRTDSNTTLPPKVHYCLEHGVAFVPIETPIMEIKVDSEPTAESEVKVKTDSKPSCDSDHGSEARERQRETSVHESEESDVEQETVISTPRGGKTSRNGKGKGKKRVKFYSIIEIMQLLKLKKFTTYDIKHSKTIFYTTDFLIIAFFICNL
ncbi:unnamed protein product [Thelazia callipaeda]|uniref:ULP_PROTEASE domain-containing protein n=1 Tax=Thelazia callipaeda TaxID=103827 RepID=A0A0N5CV08_THECL|nr:unnamed protein product [Thelazia callipaeda]